MRICSLKIFLSSNKLYTGRVEKKLPSLPKNLAETHKKLDNLNFKTKFDENFVAINDPKSNMIIFITVKNLR